MGTCPNTIDTPADEWPTPAAPIHPCKSCLHVVVLRSESVAGTGLENRVVGLSLPKRLSERYSDAERDREMKRQKDNRR